MGTKKGPHRSTCMSSKADKETFILEGNDNLFCLEKWQMSQQCDLFTCTSGTSLFNRDNLAYEGCPKRKCHNWKLLQEARKVKLEVVPRIEWAEEIAGVDYNK